MGCVGRGALLKYSNCRLTHSVLLSWSYSFLLMTIFTPPPHDILIFRTTYPSFYKILMELVGKVAKCLSKQACRINQHLSLSHSLSLCPPLFRMCVLYYAFRLFAHAIHKNITHKFCVQFHLNEEVLKKKNDEKNRAALLYSSVFLFVPSSSLMSNFSIHCCCYYLFVCFLYKREKKVHVILANFT